MNGYLSPAAVGVLKSNMAAAAFSFNKTALFQDFDELIRFEVGGKFLTHVTKTGLKFRGRRTEAVATICCSV